MALGNMLYDPTLLTTDQSFAYTRTIKPGFENYLHSGLIEFAHLTGVHPNSISIAVSVLSLAVFVIALYALLWRSLEGATGLAFLMAFLCILPVHAVGITTLGFQALGFLPRDTASAVAMALLVWYFHIVKTRATRQMPWLFIVCGLLGNVYLLVFAYLAEVALLAEIIRDRHLGVRHLGYGLAFLAGACPVIAQSLALLGNSAPLDNAVLDVRHPYMMVFPLGNAVLTGMRRELVYCLLVPPLWLAISRCGSPEERVAAQPWGALTLAAFIATFLGVIVENAANIWAPHLPRTSIFFLLGSMVICGLGLQVAARQVVPRYAHLLACGALAGILLFQSNLPSIYRYLVRVHATRDVRKEILDVAAWLREHTRADDRILAPSTSGDDVALTLRAYSLRSMNFSYKDGGVAVLDGKLAREWLDRFRSQQQVLDSRDANTLLQFMDDNRIEYAVLKDGGFTFADDQQARIRYRGTHLLVLQR